MDRLASGVVMHCVADWGFGSDWLAGHKHDLRHPASWIHGLIHMAAQLVVFPPLIAVLLGLSHMLIDTRVPIRWWCRVTRKTLTGVWAVPVLIMNDQTAHLVCLMLAARFT